MALIPHILRERFAPDAIDSVFQDVAKFMYFNRMDQKMGTYLLEFDMLRRKAEARMLIGSGFPDECVSALRTQNASLSENEKTLAPASFLNALSFAGVSAQMCRLFGPRGYASRQDVHVAAEIDTASEEEGFEARIAYRKATRAKKDGRGGGDPGKQEKRKSSEERRTGAGQVLHMQ